MIIIGVHPAAEYTYLLNFLPIPLHVELKIRDHTRRSTTLLIDTIYISYAEIYLSKGDAYRRAKRVTGGREHTKR